MVVQDDILPHPEFERQVFDATTAQAQAILSFFSEWGSFTSHALRLAAFAGYSWVTQPDAYLGTQAALMPAQFARAFVRYLEATPEDVPDDHAIWRFAHSNSVPHLVSNPNLVEHELGNSLVGNQAQGARRATVYVPETVAPSTWWDRTPLTRLKRLPAIHWSTAEPSSYERVDANRQWVIRPRRNLWETLSSQVDDIVVEAGNAINGGSLDERCRRAIQGVVEVLCDLLVVAHAAPPLPEGAFSRTCQNKCVESIAPGCLRRLELESGLSLDRRRSEQVLKEVVRLVDQRIVPQIDTTSIQEAYFEAPV
jgi:hypothetical protein